MCVCFFFFKNACYEKTVVLGRHRPATPRDLWETRLPRPREYITYYAILYLLRAYNHDWWNFPRTNLMTVYEILLYYIKRRRRDVFIHISNEGVRTRARVRDRYRYLPRHIIGIYIGNSSVRWCVTILNTCVYVIIV